MALQPASIPKLAIDALQLLVSVLTHAPEAPQTVASGVARQSVTRTGKLRLPIAAIKALLHSELPSAFPRSKWSDSLTPNGQNPVIPTISIPYILLSELQPYVR
jgi:hypothetical protein